LELAVATLSDPSRKAAYDAQLRAESAPASPAAASSVEAPNYYRMLGLAEFEPDAARIETAHMIEMSKVLRRETGPEAAAARQREEALELAFATLSDPVRKAAYDAELRSHVPDALKQSPAEAPVPPPVQPAMIYDASNDLKLHDEEEEEHDDAFDSSPASEPAETASLAPAAAHTAALEDEPLEPDAAAVTRPKKQIYASYDPAPIEKASRFSFEMPSLSLRPLLKPAAALAAVGLLAWAGFTFISFGEPVGQLSGKLTLNGQTVVGAEMRLESTSNPDHLFAGITGNEGLFQLSYRTFTGLPVGRYKITFTHQTLVGGKPLEPAEGEEEAVASEEELVTTSYIFEQDIVSGSNQIDFELSQGQKLEPARGG
jgi:hypothetical protein